MDSMVTYEIALDNIEHLTVLQKIIKKLLAIKNSLMGGGAPAAKS